MVFWVFFFINHNNICAKSKRNIISEGRLAGSSSDRYVQIYIYVYFPIYIYVYVSPNTSSDLQSTFPSSLLSELHNHLGY